MHPQEATALFSGFIYYITIPSMYMLLMIYSVFNMNDVSWGTREKKPVGNQDESAENVILQFNKLTFLQCVLLLIIFTILFYNRKRLIPRSLDLMEFSDFSDPTRTLMDHLIFLALGYSDVFCVRILSLKLLRINCMRFQIIWT